ncbi:MAG: cupin domain-containing protein [Elusimicrobia bacterium]|nr:cupin domain-containing protein [Elusimicrobiota bacterium]
MTAGTTKPKLVKKPWGHEVWWAQSKKYAGKLLVIEKGHRLSLQYHKIKHETVYTLKGRWRLRFGRASRDVGPGAVVSIPPRTIHRFEAPYGRVTLIEVSTPELWDVVRLQDDYKRSGE